VVHVYYFGISFVFAFLNKGRVFQMVGVGLLLTELVELAQKKNEYESDGRCFV
jgi:hypothetical protein